MILETLELHHGHNLVFFLLKSFLLKYTTSVLGEITQVKHPASRDDIINVDIEIKHSNDPAIIKITYLAMCSSLQWRRCIIKTMDTANDAIDDKNSSIWLVRDGYIPTRITTIPPIPSIKENHQIRPIMIAQTAQII